MTNDELKTLLSCSNFYLANFQDASLAVTKLKVSEAESRCRPQWLALLFVPISTTLDWGRRFIPLMQLLDEPG